MNVQEVIRNASASGVQLRVEGCVLKYTSAGPLPDEIRQLLLQHKPAILMHLTMWTPTEANRLLFDADSLVGKLDVSGTDPLIQAHAARAVEAHRLRDMTGVCSAVRELENAARRLASQRKISTEKTPRELAEDHAKTGN